MAYTTINKPSATAFNTKLYTGTGSTASITGVGFQPDFSWIKVRNNSDQHVIFDAVRGATKRLEPSTAIAEATISDELTAFNSDGFSIGGADRVNRNNDTYVSWNFKANGAGSANTGGTINSTVSVNQTTGFSIVSWAGTNANATVGHGLSSEPTFVIYKVRGEAGDWAVYNKNLGANKYLLLNGSGAESADAGMFQNTDPTNGKLYVGGNLANKSYPMIAYCFTPKTGYSKFGSYTGNGSSEGSFIYTGFKPQFIITKRTDNSSGGHWLLYDTKRDPSNVADIVLATNNSSEAGWGNTFDMDILSNGFKMRAATTYSNVSGANYIYIAFAEAPLVGSNNIPATAR